MLYLSKTDLVLWPLMAIATRSGTPARTMLRTAVRLIMRSTGILPLTPAAKQAFFHLL